MFSFHRALAELDSRLGPNNPILQFRLKRLLRKGANLSVRFSEDVIELSRAGKTIKIASKHWMFVRDVALDFDSFFETIVSHGCVLDFSQPQAHVYRGTGLQFMLTSLPEESAAIESYFSAAAPKAGSLAFDIGANCGVTTQRLAQMVGPKGRVIAFEPDPENYQALLSNIRHHGLTNVAPIPKAVSEKEGTSQFNLEGSLGSGLSAFIPRPVAGRACQVECMTLSQSFLDFGTPSFVKMDVEGAELSILESSEATLRRFPCSFALDTGHRVGDGDTAERVETIFRRAGYESGTLRLEGGCVTTWANPTTRL